MEKILVLLSGGLDSVVLANKLARDGYEVCGILFNYGQEFYNKEVDCAVKCVNDLRDKGYEASLYIQGLSMLEANKDGYNPSRNLIFLSYAVRYAEREGISIISAGFISAEEYDMEFSDANEQFVFNYFNLIYAMHKMTFSAPLIKFNKGQVYQLAKELGIKLENTWSCNYPVWWDDDTLVPCGKCSDCLQRLKFVAGDSIMERVRNMFLQGLN